MSAVCPIVSHQVDENKVRLVALCTTLLSLAACYTLSPVLISLLVFDFFLRAFALGPFSPLARVADLLLSFLPLDPTLTNYGPKLFATRLGFVMLALIALATGAELLLASKIMLLMLALFAFLEAAFSFCVGCVIYSQLQRLRHAI
ncbi:MAG: hypothetical protein C0621_05255 [Desulfuromonas sp.]|nr:MAG: hypothetical protein C0621_05255 [Desulfuromonas sp.]